MLEAVVLGWLEDLQAMLDELRQQIVLTNEDALSWQCTRRAP